MSEVYKPFNPTFESALNLAKGIWEEKKQQLRESGYSYESLTVSVCKQLGFELTHEQFVAWVANGRVPQ